MTLHQQLDDESTHLAAQRMSSIGRGQRRLPSKSRVGSQRPALYFRALAVASGHLSRC